MEAFFLPEEHRNPQASKYLKAILTYPLNRLSKEPNILRAEQKSCEKSMNDLAISQSRSFVQAAEQLAIVQSRRQNIETNLNQLGGSLSRQLTSKDSSSESLKTCVQKIKENRSATKLQQTLLEILDISRLLNVCIQSELYSEGVQLIKYTQSLFDIHADIPVVQKIKTDVDLLAEKLVSSIIERMSNGGQPDKLVPILLNFRSEDEARRIFFAAKIKVLESKIHSRSNPYSFLLEYIEAMDTILNSCKKEFDLVFPNQEQKFFEYFVFDVVTDFITDIKDCLPILTNFQEIYEIYVAVVDLNKNTLIPFQCSISTMLIEVFTGTTTQKFQQMMKKLYSHYENSVKIYSWEKNKDVDSGPQEFITLGILYNNFITLINEVRSFPYLRLKDTFYKEIGDNLAKIAKMTTRNQILLTSPHLTRQQQLDRDRFLKYLSCMNNVIFPEVIKYALQSYDNSEEYEAEMRKTVEIIQNAFAGNS